MAGKRTKWSLKQYSIGEEVDKEFWKNVAGNKKWSMFGIW